MQERLLEMGEWLELNGEAIYGTQPWSKSSDGELVRYTCKQDAVYAIRLERPTCELTLNIPKPAGNAMITMLGLDAPLQWYHSDGKLTVEIPPIYIMQIPPRHAYVLKIKGLS